ncbi:hypothetical protein ACWCPV_31190, partial [Streptomyces tubercidicus]
MPQDSAPSLLHDTAPATPGEPAAATSGEPAAAASRPTYDAAFDWLEEARAARHRAGLARTLRPRPADSPLLDLAGNDYLGFARHPEVTRGGGGGGGPPARASSPLHSTHQKNKHENN